MELVFQKLNLISEVAYYWRLAMQKESIEIGLPDKIEFSDHGHFIGIIRKWFGLKIIFLTFFVII